MEKGTVFGSIGGMILLIAGMWIGSGDLSIYGDISSVFITFGGSIGALLVSTPWKHLGNMLKLMRMAYKEKSVDPSATIETLVTFAEKARKEGVLSLEEDVEEIPDIFLRRAIQLVVDGTDPEIDKRIMYNEIDQMEGRHAEGKKIFDDWGYMMPSFGMIGTLIGLIAMLRNLDDKASIGKNMGIALITTLYGAVGANLFSIPIANKLSYFNGMDVLMKEIIVEGVLSIQAGDNPAILREKLNSFMAVSMRTQQAKD
ncbi:MAG: motility protein A [Brevinematales bacterium]|nr:motility protein A [Brevinematales bacterium]